MTREEAKSFIMDISYELGYMDVGYLTKKDEEKMREAIKVLEQEPKTGHWIRMKAYEKWECSECHTIFRFTFKEHDYCPNCGVKMVEHRKARNNE